MVMLAHHEAASFAQGTPGPARGSSSGSVNAGVAEGVGSFVLWGVVGLVGRGVVVVDVLVVVALLVVVEVVVLGGDVVVVVVVLVVVVLGGDVVVVVVALVVVGVVVLGGGVFTVVRLGSGDVLELVDDMGFSLDDVAPLIVGLVGCLLFEVRTFTCGSAWMKTISVKKQMTQLKVLKISQESCPEPT